MCVRSHETKCFAFVNIAICRVHVKNYVSTLKLFPIAFFLEIILVKNNQVKVSKSAKYYQQNKL